MVFKESEQFFLIFCRVFLFFYVYDSEEAGQEVFLKLAWLPMLRVCIFCLFGYILNLEKKWLF